MSLGGQRLANHCAARVRSPRPLQLACEDSAVELLLLQGRPIAEPVVQHGPFVMDTAEEIRQTIADYQRTGFGRWPFERDAPVPGRETGRFALHADGREDRPGTPSELVSPPSPVEAG